MASRRKKVDNLPATDVARAFTVAVEQLQGQFRAFGERLDLVEQNMHQRFDKLDRRLDRIEHALEAKVDRDEVEKIVERVVARHAS